MNQHIVLSRSVACLMVILVHVGEQWYYRLSVNDIMFEISTIAIIIGRVAVPIFFMIGGALLFNNSRIFTISLLKKRLLSIFLPLSVFSIFYYLYTFWLGVLFNTYTVHLWYLVYILPVYTVSPFIKMPQEISQKEIIQILGILFFLFFITESVMTNPYRIDLKYSFNQALLYMFIGFFLYRLPKKGNPFIWLGIFVILIQCGYFLVLFENGFRFSSRYDTDSLWFEYTLKVFQFLFGNQTDILESYKTLGVLLQGSTLFLFLQTIPIKEHPWIILIAKHSLSIYGWHMIFVVGLAGYFSHLPSWLAFISLFIVAFLGSLLIGITWEWLKNIRKLSLSKFP